jgi:hypothetical protein
MTGIQDTPGLTFPPPLPIPSPSETAMEEFRNRARAATAKGLVGAFPTFMYADRDGTHYGGAVFIKNEAAILRDVPLAELENVSLDDFGARMRAASDYATKNGFAAAFPNFYHADNGGGIVCGTVLLNAGSVEFHDVPLAKLGVSLDDIAGRIGATNTYAAGISGFVGGFPNFYHAGNGTDIVCGTILVPESTGEFEDVALYTIPVIK